MTISSDRAPEKLDQRRPRPMRHPGDATGDVILAYRYDREGLEKLFESVTEVARFHHPFVMDRRNDKPLYLCRGLKIPVSSAWPLIKAYY